MVFYHLYKCKRVPWCYTTRACIWSVLAAVCSHTIHIHSDISCYILTYLKSGISIINDILRHWGSSFELEVSKFFFHFNLINVLCAVMTKITINIFQFNPVTMLTGYTGVPSDTMHKIKAENWVLWRLHMIFFQFCLDWLVFRIMVDDWPFGSFMCSFVPFTQVL